MTPDLQTLRLTVLELMGWKRFPIEPHHNYTGNVWLQAPNDSGSMGHSSKMWRIEEAPDPTASLSDCEPLLEEVRKAGLLVAMTTDSKGWHCGLGDDSGAIYNAKSESLTVAICLVFSKWNGAK